MEGHQHLPFRLRALFWGHGNLCVSPALLWTSCVTSDKSLNLCLPACNMGTSPAPASQSTGRDASWRGGKSGSSQGWQGQVRPWMEDLSAHSQPPERLLLTLT